MKKYAVEHTMQMAIDITKKIQALGKEPQIDPGVPLLSIPVTSSTGLQSHIPQTRANYFNHTH